MGYYVDLKSISIDEYKDILKSAELIPSWKILEDNIDEILDSIDYGHSTCARIEAY